MRTLVYRDYTPTGWDGGTRTCTLLIDAGHEGQGSRWVKGLKAGDPVYYLGIASSHHQPAPGKRLIFLGDETAIGHFLSLQQLTGTGARIGGAVTIAQKHYEAPKITERERLRREAGQKSGVLELEKSICGAPSCRILPLSSQITLSESRRISGR